MSKSKIKLKFSNVHHIWSFVQEISAINIEINTKDITLICDCADADEALAKEKYSASRIAHFVPKSFEQFQTNTLQRTYEN